MSQRTPRTFIGSSVRQLPVSLAVMLGASGRVAERLARSFATTTISSPLSSTLQNGVHRKVPAGSEGSRAARDLHSKYLSARLTRLVKDGKPWTSLGYRWGFGFSATAAITIASTVMINGRAGTYSRAWSTR
jgi:hypothetical protein